MDTVTELPEAERRRRRDYVLFALLLAVGAALRLWRLDGMSFRFDSAEAMFRARETFRDGHPPLTGIMNSLGFRNPGGFVWIILPTALFSPKPQLTTAWIGIIGLSGAVPLFCIGRRFLQTSARWIPVLAYLFMPTSVFGARNIWAQNLMPALSAWALMWSLCARDFSNSESRRHRAALAAFGASCTMALVHLSGLVWAALVAWLVRVELFGFRNSAKRVSRMVSAVSVLAVSVALMLPAVFDALDAYRHPRAKPDYAAQFDAAIGPTPPLMFRVIGAARAPFRLIGTGNADSGMDVLVNPAIAIGAQIVDIALLAAILLGIFAPFSRQGGMPDRPRARAPDPVVSVLFVWSFLCIPITIATLRAPNSSYFTPAVPGLLMLAGYGIFAVEERLARRWKRTWIAPVLAGFVIIAVYGVGNCLALQAIDREDLLPGEYYIPLRLQEQFVRQAAESGVRPGRLAHLSGMWFQHSYDYLHKNTVRFASGKAMPAALGNDQVALLDDLALRARQPARTKWMEDNLPTRIGTVRFGIFSSEQAPKAINSFVSTPRD